MSSSAGGFDVPECIEEFVNIVNIVAVLLAISSRIAPY